MIFRKMQEKKEAELRRQKKETAKKVGVALVIGSVVSSVATLFTAPKSGKEMRQDVADKVEEGTEIVKEGATKVAKKTSEVVSEAITKGQELKEKVIVKVKNDMKKNEIADRTDEIVDEVEGAAGEVKEEIEDNFK